MFKVICMFALVGLVAAAPVLQATQDQEAVISTIMSSLQPAIDAAIARALGENSVTTITVEGTYGIPTAVDALPALSGSFSGFQSSASYGSSGSYVDSQEQNGVDGATYHDTGYDHQHDGNSQHQQQNSFASTANYGVSKGVNSGTTLVSTAGAGGVVYHDANQVSNVNTVNSNANVQDVQTNVQTQVQQSEVTLSKAAQSQKLVSSVLNALAPSVEIAVQKALAAMMAQMQQQAAAVSTTSTTSQSSSSSSSISASQELSLVTKIIEVLTPSIASSVRKALAARYEAQQAQAAFAAQQAAEEQAAQQQAAAAFAAQQEAAAAFAAQQEAAAAFAAQQEAAAAFAAQQEAAAALAAQQEAAAAFAAQQEAAAAFAAQQEAAAAFAAQQQAAAEYAAQQEAAAAFAAQQAAAQSSSALIAQIIAALKPSIATSVSSALEANRFSQQQQSQSFVSNNQASQQQSSQSSSSGLSNTSLSNIFGDGSAHNVKVETDSYQYEYNNSK